MDLGDGLGTLLFTVNGKPLYGSIFAPSPESPGGGDQRPDIGSCFDRNVKPGSG